MHEDVCTALSNMEMISGNTHDDLKGVKVIFCGEHQAIMEFRGGKDLSALQVFTWGDRGGFCAVLSGHATNSPFLY